MSQIRRWPTALSGTASGKPSWQAPVRVHQNSLALGRPFTAEEERLGVDTHVAIISFSLWQQRGGDPNMLGRSVRVNGEPFTVVGVAAEGFTGTGIPGPGVWTALGVGARDAAGYDEARSRQSHLALVNRRDFSDAELLPGASEQVAMTLGNWSFERRISSSRSRASLHGRGKISRT